MRNIFNFCLLALSLGTFSCSTESGPGDTGNPAGDGTSGQVTINLGFAKAPATQAAYPLSTAKPTTSWDQNIKDLHILFVSTLDQKVKAARELALQQSSTGGSLSFMLQNIPASPAGGAYDVYVVANSKTGANIERTWEPASVTGYDISSLLMKLKEQALGEKPGDPAKDPEKDSKGYIEPAEIFIGKSMGVTVAADVNNTIPAIALSRAVGMMRVRINQSAGNNQNVKFDVDNASLRIRRTGTNINMLGTVGFASPKRDKAVLYVKGKFNTANPSAPGYTTGTILDPTNNITRWKDILTLPGGSATEGSKKFDIVLIGEAPAGYIPLGKTQGLAAPALVAWSGAVQEDIEANKILEVNLTLNSSGKWLDDPNEPGIPEPGQYGDVTIDVNLAEWGAIESTDIPL